MFSIAHYEYLMNFLLQQNTRLKIIEINVYFIKIYLIKYPMRYLYIFFEMKRLHGYTSRKPLRE